MTDRIRVLTSWTLIALLALFTVLAGSAVAAKRRRKAQPLPASGIVARVRSRAPVTTATTAPLHPTFTSDPLSGASWTQGARDFDQLVGEVEVTEPAEATCSPRPPAPYPTGAGSGMVYVMLNGTIVGQGGGAAVYGPDTVALPIGWRIRPTLSPAGEVGFAFFLPTAPFLSLWEAGASRRWTLTAETADNCGVLGGNSGGHFIIRAIRINVLRMN